LTRCTAQAGWHVYCKTFIEEWVDIQGEEADSRREKMAETNDLERPAGCRNCGKPFTATEMAAARVEDASTGACIVTCTSCSTENELVVQPVGGLDHQPGIVVTGTKAMRTSEKNEPGQNGFCSMGKNSLILTPRTICRSMPGA
jgi:RNase P subunit RPR2